MPADASGAGAPAAGAAAKGGRVGASEAPASKYDNELDENWFAIAEEEERNTRRATVAGTLAKMLNTVAKHKWAYPFKRPVTDKEAPDYRDVITNPMDLTTLRKKVETGAVDDVDKLTSDLSLIFENAMTYNGKGSELWNMANTLKEVCKHQQVSAREHTSACRPASLLAPCLSERRRRRLLSSDPWPPSTVAL